MTYRWLEHTSEMELSLSGESAEAVFEEATVAIGELLAEDSGEPVERELRVSAQDLPSLLAEWLGELVYLAETDAFIPERALRIELSEDSAAGTVAGQRCAPQTLVKGVTYHGLELRSEDGIWHGHVVLDV